MTVFTIEGLAISLVVDQLQRRARILGETAQELDSERQLVERMALEDVMTGLANRRAFERDMERLLARSGRADTAMTLAIADIDGLKCANDTLGHKQGDALILAVAAALRESCRASDEAYRIGGDEFALLLPGTDRKAFDVLLQRLAGRIHEVSASFPGTGLSVGAAHVPEDGNTTSELVRLADSRMYEAKAAASTASRPTNGSTSLRSQVIRHTLDLPTDMTP